MSGTTGYLNLFPPPNGEPDWQDAKLAPLLKFPDQHLRRRTWLVDEPVTLAAVSVAAIMTYARTGHFPFDNYSGPAPRPPGERDS